MIIGEGTFRLVAVLFGSFQRTHTRLSTAESASAVSPQRVTILGVSLIVFSALGFYVLPGMIAEDADGSPIVNAIYCAVITLTT